MFGRIDSGDVSQRKYSEFVLVELDDGTWKATQPQVDVVGTGESMPAAVEHYCQSLLQQRQDHQ